MLSKEELPCPEEKEFLPRYGVRRGVRRGTPSVAAEVILFGYVMIDFVPNFVLPEEARRGKSRRSSSSREFGTSWAKHFARYAQRY